MTSEFDETVKVLDYIAQRGYAGDDDLWWIEIGNSAVFVLLIERNKFMFCDHKTFDSGFELLEHMAAFDGRIAKMLSGPL